MLDDKDDRVNRILRGNTDHDPKPDFAARQNALPRGLAAPTPAPGWGGGFGGGRPAQRPPERPAPADMRNGPKPPIAPKLPDDQKPTFRRLGDPKPNGPKSPDQDSAPDKVKFRGLGRDDLGRGKGHSR